MKKYIHVDTIVPSPYVVTESKTGHLCLGELIEALDGKYGFISKVALVKMWLFGYSIWMRKEKMWAYRKD